MSATPNDRIAAIRADYTMAELNEASVDRDPMVFFMRWFNEAVSADIVDVNAMTLSSIGLDGFPDSRVVLLKGVEANAFHFYTNYNSAKGQQLQQHPQVALNFFWKELQRQVRVTGVVEKLSVSQNQPYFSSRPLGSQIGTWASPQSTVIAQRQVLEDRVSAIERQFANLSVLPCPEFWGGFAVHPVKIEFWQGRSSRLHDRLRFTKQNNAWNLERLAP